jgi:hypothetical protein
MSLSGSIAARHQPSSSHHLVRHDRTISIGTMRLSRSPIECFAGSDIYSHYR